MFRKVIVSCLFVGAVLCLNEAELFGTCDDVDFACKNLKQAKACGAVKTCISQVWSSKEYSLSVPKLEQYEICAKFVKKARMYFPLSSQEEMKELMHSWCGNDNFIEKFWCFQMIDKYMNELEQILNSDMEPGVICIVTGIPYLESTVNEILDAVDGNDETALDIEDTDWTFAASIIKADDDMTARYQETMSSSPLTVDCVRCTHDIINYELALGVMLGHLSSPFCALLGPLKSCCLRMYRRMARALKTVEKIFPPKRICEILRVCPFVSGKDEKEKCSDCISSFMNTYKTVDSEAIPLYPLRVAARINCERLGECAAHGGLQNDAK